MGVTWKLAAICATIALSLMAAEDASASPAPKIWGIEPTTPAIILGYDLNGNLLDFVTAPHGGQCIGIVQIGHILYYACHTGNAVYAYDYVNNSDLGLIFSTSGVNGFTSFAWDGSHFWIGEWGPPNRVLEYS